MNIDDPKLTAFALDELEEPERSTIARAIADSPEAQRYVDETRALAAALKNEFANELTADAMAASGSDGFPAVNGEKADGRGDRHSLLDIGDDPWFWAKARPLAVAAAIAICALIAAIVIGTYKKRSDSFHSVAVDYPPIEGQHSVPAAASEFSGPETIPNPLGVQTMARIERIVIGEFDVDPHLESGELRLIEVINDAYRIQRLRQRLTIPVLSKERSRTLGGHHTYGLIFLDRTGAIVASARFCHLPDSGFVLQPLQNVYERNGRYFIGRGAVLPGNWQSDVDYSAYAIPFPDWNECIGYAPGA